MSLSRDERMVQRYVDGELSEPAAAAFATRLLREPGLREQVSALQSLTSHMLPPAPSSAPDGFTADVLTAVRRLPERVQLEQAEVAAGAVQLCVRVLIAAALVLGLGLAWHAGLLAPGVADTLEAGPPTVEQELQRLDELILESMEGPRGGK